MQLLIGERARIAWFSFPDNRSLIFAPGGEMAIQTIVRKIELPSDKPSGKWLVPIEDRFPFLEPVQIAGNLCPEFLGLVDGTLIDAIIILSTLNMCRCAEVIGWCDEPAVAEKGIHVGLRLQHYYPPN